MGVTSSHAGNNSEMIVNMVREKYIRSLEVERAFRIVDRGLFFPCKSYFAYDDSATSDDNFQIASTSFYCEVFEGLGLCPGMSFLTIGSGPGYANTVAGFLLGENDWNHGIDTSPEMVRFAKQHVNSFLKSSKALDLCNFCMPEFVTGDILSYSTDRKYDRVFCAINCRNDTMLDELKNLVKVGGRLMTPMGNQLLLFIQTSRNEFSRNMVIPTTAMDHSRRVKNDVKNSALPTSHVKPLHKLARSTIRSTMRRKILKDYPQMRYSNSYIVSYDEKTGGEKPIIMTPKIFRISVEDGSQVTHVIDEDDEDERSRYPPNQKELDKDCLQFTAIMRENIKSLGLPETEMKFINRPI